MFIKLFVYAYMYNVLFLCNALLRWHEIKAMTNTWKENAQV